MDSLITAAALALGAGDPLGALRRIALRNDPAALALRGIAMAQLGDLPRARMLLRRAARDFGPRESLARARCVVAEAEVALAARDLARSTKALDTATATLEKHGDALNVAHARYLESRRLLLLGRVDEAERQIAGIDPSRLAPAGRTAYELVHAGIAIRRLLATPARAALRRAAQAAEESRIPALIAEVDGAVVALNAPAARLVTRAGEQLLTLDHVEALLASRAFIVDACRHAVRHRQIVVPLARRPVLFAIARALGVAYPDGVTRSQLVAQAFGGKQADESHRARLRVEISRLRKAIAGVADVSATATGFVLQPRKPADVVVLQRPYDELDEEHSAVLAFLHDGETWSSSALALALGRSQRTVQRALDALASSGRVHSFGQGRAMRWMTPPVIGFTTTLLLPAPLPAE